MDQEEEEEKEEEEDKATWQLEQYFGLKKEQGTRCKIEIPTIKKEAERKKRYEGAQAS